MPQAEFRRRPDDTGRDLDPGPDSGSDFDHLAADCLPGVRRVYAYWRSRCRDGMPQRADIDPIDLRSLLPRLALVDVLSGPRFHYRVAGTELVRDLGYELTGRYVDTVHAPGRATELAADYSRVAAFGRPVFQRRPWPDGGWTGRRAEMLYLPLGSRAYGVRMILSYTERMPSQLA
jgi:hypothetical protein